MKLTKKRKNQGKSPDLATFSRIILDRSSDRPREQLSTPKRLENEDYLS